MTGHAGAAEQPARVRLPFLIQIPEADLRYALVPAGDVRITMTDPERDPWHWSVDQVVNYFSTSIISDAEDAVPIVEALRANRVDGKILVDYLDDARIERDLRLSATWQKAAFQRAIDELRYQSAKYVELAHRRHQMQLRIAVLHANPSPAATPPQPRNALPASDVALSPDEPANDGQRNSSVAKRRQASSAELVDSPPKKFAGKKRAVLTQVPRPEAPNIDASSLAPRSERPDAEFDPNPHAYLKQSKVSIDKFFYGSLPDGADLGLSESSDDDELICPSVEDKNKVAQGQRSFTKKRMQHFLRREFQPLAKNLPIRVATPYPARLADSSVGQSVSLLRSYPYRLRKWNARKLDVIEKTPEPKVPAGSTEKNGTWDFDYLLRRRDRDHSAELSSLNEDDEVSLSGSFVAELEAETKDAAKGVFLSHDQKEAAISAALEQFEADWREKKLPRLVATAYKFWQEKITQRDPPANLLARAEVERLDRRLQRMRNDILTDEWRSVGAIKKQCQSMDLTVFEKLKFEWKLNLWKAAKVPPKPKIIPRPKKVKTVDDANDEDDVEILTSDSEAVSDVNMGTAEGGNEPCANGVDMTATEEVDLADVPTRDDETFESSHSDYEDIDETAMDYNSEAGLSAANQSSSADYMDIQEVASSLLTEEISEELEHPTSNFDGAPVIDLTSSRDVSPNDEVQLFYERAEEMTPEEIEMWDYAKLEEDSDRMRIVLKLLHDHPRRRRMLFKHIFQDHSSGPLRQDENLESLLNSCCDALDVLGNTADSGPSQGNLEMALLFICWAKINHIYWTDKRPSPVPKQVTVSVIEYIVDNFWPFCRFLEKIRPVFMGREVESAGHSKFTEPTSDDLDNIEDSDGIMATVTDTPRKKRKRPVAQSAKAKAIRDMADTRTKEEADQRRKNMSQLQESELRTTINPGKKDHEEFVFIPDSIASRIKDHQLEGVRFLWREIVTSDEKSAQGCLLAHTMGLGKTMQAITLMATLVRATQDPKTCKQLPKSLRHVHYLLLCPPSLIENWQAELQMWAPDESLLSTPFVVEARLKTNHRHSVIADWVKEGGLIIISYDMFRSTIQNKRSAIPERLHKPMTEWLTTTSNVVFADEAHKMKNAFSGIAATTSRFSTHRRIALTGSPLANNLNEYYAMLDWVAPGFLGSSAEFKAWYKEPIEAGLYVDSTRQEQRKSLKMLKALKRVIENKVNRADISVLKADLRPKTEFVLTMPLEQLQWDMYTLFAKWMYSQNPAGDETFDRNTRLWAVLNLLSLLLIDPWLFYQDISAKAQGKESAARAQARAQMDDDNTNVDLTQDVEQNQTLARQVKDLMSKSSVAGPLESISPKLRLILHIAKLAKQAGDRVLIFSRRLHTLTAISRYLAQNGVATIRMDGSTPMDERQQMSNTFGTSKNQADALLISTRAGNLGLNIIGANRVILVDFGFDPTVEEQAVGRAYRIGQPKHVYVYHLVVGGTFESPLHSMTIFKKQLASRVVDSKNLSRTSMKTRDFVQEPQAVEAQDVSEYRGKDRAVMDKLLDDSSPCKDLIRAMSTAETLHVEIDEPLTEEEQHEVEALIREERRRLEEPGAARPPFGPASVTGDFAMQQKMFTEARARHAQAPAVPQPQQFPGRPPLHQQRTVPPNYMPPPWRSTAPPAGPVPHPLATGQPGGYPSTAQGAAERPLAMPKAPAQEIPDTVWETTLGPYQRRESFQQLRRLGTPMTLPELFHLKRLVERDAEAGSEVGRLTRALQQYRYKNGAAPTSSLPGP